MKNWEIRIKKFCPLFCSLLFTFTLISGCATSKDVGRITWDIGELRAEIGKLKQNYQSIEAQLPKESGKVSEKLQGMEEEQKATSKALSDLMMKVQTLSNDVQVLMGRFEEARYISEKNIKELSTSKDSLIAQIKEIEFAVNDLKKRLANIESERVLLQQQKITEDLKKKEDIKLQEPQKEKPDVKNVYTEAYNAYTAGNIKEAREGFISVLKDYPENKYSENARFLMAESYYKDKEYKDAILAYEELLEKNPDSRRVPDALLKQGLAFYAIKDDKIGKTTLEKLIEKFPNSEQAKTARKKIGKPEPIKNTKKKSE